MVERAQRRLVHRRYAEPVFEHRRRDGATSFGSPRSTSKRKSQNPGRLSPSTQVTSRNAGGQRRSRTLARRTGSPRGNRWIFTSGSAYPAQRRAISLRSDIRSASIDYGGASFRCYRRKPKHRLLAKSPRRWQDLLRCCPRDSERFKNVTPRLEMPRRREQLFKQPRKVWFAGFPRTDTRKDQSQ